MNHPRTKKSYTAYYESYRLSKYRGFPCEVRRMNADALEKLCLETVDRLSWDEAAVAEAAANQVANTPHDSELRQKEAALADRLIEVHRKIGNIVKAVEDGLAGKLSAGQTPGTGVADGCSAVSDRPETPQPSSSQDQAQRHRGCHERV